MNLYDYFADSEDFTLKEAEDVVPNLVKKEVKLPSIRARIYEDIDKGLSQRLLEDVHSVTRNQSTYLLIKGNGCGLSYIDDNSTDFIVTDHPYDLKSNKGGNRNFAEYKCFRHDVKDFQEKRRALKPGCFLIEFLPDKNGGNRVYLNQTEEMAVSAEFRFYVQVPWIEGAGRNTGRKIKDRENIVFFSKGKAREPRRNAKKGRSDSSKEYRMSGARRMLPPSSEYPALSKKECIHQAERPLDLLKEIIDLISVEQELGLDQFAGSGVAGEAALGSNRDMILTKEDKDTFNRTKERISRKGRVQDEKIL